MSTRCQVIVCDGYDEIWFYHHWNGYPSAMGPKLEAFLDKIKTGLIRDNAEQSCGWLVRDNLCDATNGWKASDFEPCAPRMHGDIEWLYRIHVAAKTIKMCKVKYDDSYDIMPLGAQVFTDLDVNAS